MSGQTPPTSRIQIFKSKIEWSVEKSAFDTPEGSENSIRSTPFFASPNNEVLWELLLHPRGRTDENRDYVSLFLVAWGISDPIQVKYKLGLIASGAEANTLSSDKLFPKTATDYFSWGWTKFIKRDVLFDPTKNFLRGDQVTFFCNLEVQFSLDVKVPECSTFGHDWSELLETGKFSDVILVVRGKEIKAHKKVLSARSPVFEEMFKQDTTENKTIRVLIQDLDITGVKALLTYIYSEEVIDLKRNAEKVLAAADKYGVDRLKALCEKEICKKLTIENAADMLRLAVLHTAKQLKAQVLSFIISNKADVVEQKSFWKLNDVNKDLFEEVVELSLQLGNSNPIKIKHPQWIADET